MITKGTINKVLKKAKDPEIGIDIVTLELVYGINIKKDNVRVKMTLTSPMCPYGPELVNSVKQEIKKVKGIKKVDVDVVFDPPWQPSEELKDSLGLA